jgi:phage shock protein A
MDSPSGAAPPPAPLPEALVESIQKLVRRIEELESRTAEAVIPLAEKVGELSRKIEEARHATAGAAPAVERAVTRLAERIERLETGSGIMPASRAEAPSPRRRPGLFGRLFGD